MSWRVGESVVFCENLPAGRQVCEKPLLIRFVYRKDGKTQTCLPAGRERKTGNLKSKNSFENRKSYFELWDVGIA